MTQVFVFVTLLSWILMALLIASYTNIKRTNDSLVLPFTNNVETNDNLVVPYTNMIGTNKTFGCSLH